MYILGLIGVKDKKGHDCAAALYKDGEIVAAAEEERFIRKRHAYNESPVNAIKYCLDYAGITLSDVDHITCGWLETLGENPGEQKLGEWIVKSNCLTEIILPREVFDYDDAPQIHFVKHHIAHLCSVFYTSNFDESAFIIVDGAGEDESTTIGHISNDQISLNKSWPMGNSLGIFYDAAVSYSGLEYNSAGKFMGLTSFGSLTNAETIQLEVVNNKDEELVNSKEVKNVIAYWIDQFTKHFYPYAKGTKEDVFYYGNFASSIQNILEQNLLYLARTLKDSTQSNNLVLSGGVSLNCVANSVVEEANIFENMYVQPAANDSGCSFGSILALCHHLKLPIKRKFTPYLGRDYSDQEIDTTKYDQFDIKKLKEDELIKKVAIDLADNKIVAWFQGRAEIGPRALGNRSILSNPASRENLQKVNKLKSRENWRPLAPSILSESANEVLQSDSKSQLFKYMLGATKIRSEWRSRVPAVVHIDGSARPQVVSKSDNLLYHKLISEFLDITDIPLLTNTSFNLGGEPIVETIQNALDAFIVATDIDVLVINENYIVRK